MTALNDAQALHRRRDAGTLTWRGPASMLFARSGCAVAAQALVAGIFALRLSPTPWRDTEPWLPVYGTLIDAGCLALLWRLTQREGIRLFDLLGVERTRLGRDGNACRRVPSSAAFFPELRALPPRGSIMLGFWRLLTIVLSALALTMTSAHVLELPQKMTYDAEMYAAVNTTLYRYFAIVGGPYQIGAIVSAAVMTLLLRGRPVIFRWAFVGTLFLLLAFVSWLVLVLPVNREVAAALDASPQSVPSLWLQLRDRWEYGHATGFALHFAGFSALVWSVVRDARPRADH